LRLSDTQVDVFCDPQGESPLEIDNRTLTMTELIEALQPAKGGANGKRNDMIHPMRGKEERVIPARRAA
jgi:hypothetical protein